MFDRTAHMRLLSNDPVLRARREDALRKRLCIVWDADMDAKLVEMATAGIGAIPIGNAIGVGKLAVRKRRQELGLPKGKAPGGRWKVKQPAGTVVVRLLEN
jgi:hypothetical protein